MRDVGQLPQELLQEYLKGSGGSGTSGEKGTRALMRRLDDVKAELKRYQNINQKALDQFTQFTDQREGLTRRQAELDKSRKVF